MTFKSINSNENNPSEIYKWIERCNYLFLFIYTIEAILKLTGLGIYYFYDSWNKLDLGILCLSFTIHVLRFANVGIKIP